MSNSINNPSTTSQKKLTIDEQYLQDYPDLVKRDPKNPKRYVCIPCDKKDSPFATGTWNNYKGHIDTGTHIKNLPSEPIETEDSHTPPEEGKKVLVGGLSKKTITGTRNPVPQSLSLAQKAELDGMFTKFILQNNLPFSIIDSLVGFTKEICNQFPQNLLSQYNASRKTVARVTSQMSTTLKAGLFEQLRCSPFSLSIDEGSDLYGSSYLAICARFFDAKLKRLSIKLVSVLPVTNSKTGETLYNMIKNEILCDPKIEANFMGMVSDEGGNLAGCDRGVSGRLLNDYPYIVNAKDFSHLYNTVFKKALETLPKDKVSIITSTCAHFSRSTQRKALLKDIQKEKKLVKKTVLRYAETRWLSLNECLERQLELWESLNHYFAKYGTKAEKTYTSDTNLLYLKIFSFLFDKINSYNLYFQKENLFYDAVTEKIQLGYVVFNNLIVKPGLKSLNFEDHFPRPYEKLKKASILEGKFGSDIEAVLNTDEEFRDLIFSSPQLEETKQYFDKLSSTAQKTLLTASKKFIVMALKYMKKKFPYKEQIINDTKVIFLKEFDKTKWIRLQKHFTNIISTDKMKKTFGNELDSLEFQFDDISSVVKMKKVSILETWNTLGDEYPTLSMLARAILVLPHSSVSVERVFSTLKNIKNSKRNRMTVQNLEACILSYQQRGKSSIVVISDEETKGQDNESTEIVSNAIQKDDLVSEHNVASQNTSDTDAVSSDDNDDGEDYGFGNVKYVAKTEGSLKKIVETHMLDTKRMKKNEDDKTSN